MSYWFLLPMVYLIGLLCVLALFSVVPKDEVDREDGFKDVS